MAKVLVVYYSRSGHVRKMAEEVVKGVKAAGAEVDLLTVEKCTVDCLLQYEGIIIGSPTYYGIVAGPIKDLLDRSVVHHKKLEGKVGGVFASAGILGGGAETTLISILQMMLVHGMVLQGSSKGCHYGAVAIGSPDNQALDECRALGNRVGNLAIKLYD